MANPCAGSTAPSLGTRSRTWPYEARTVKSLPRYLLIVLALAGDSTMRRFLAMAGGCVLAVRAGGWGRHYRLRQKITPAAWATGVHIYSGITPRAGLSSRRGAGSRPQCAPRAAT